MQSHRPLLLFFGREIPLCIDYLQMHLQEFSPSHPHGLQTILVTTSSTIWLFAVLPSPISSAVSAKEQRDRSCCFESSSASDMSSVLTELQLGDC